MMGLDEVVSKLTAAGSADKQEFYLNIMKLLTENGENVSEDITSENLDVLCATILDHLKNETSECPQLIKLFQCLFQNKHLHKVFTEKKKIEVMKDIISYIDTSQSENLLVNCFSIIEISPSLNLENSVLCDLLNKMEDILTKKNEAISAHFIICNYFQKFIKDYESRLSNFIPALSKLVFLPLCHPSSKIREVAEKTLDMFPKLLLYTSDEEATSYLLKLVKESYSRNLLLLFKEKQELYVLKVWKHVVNALGSVLPANLPTITPFFQVIEKGFKSTIDDVCIAAFLAWKNLISCFALTDGVLNDSKKLRFILKPFKNIARLSENILLIACDSWWHLAWSLSGHLSARFTEVCIPLLELTVGKFNGHSEKAVPKGGSISLIKKCCFMLLRFLEQPPTENSRLSSPKKLPLIPYPPLQSPIDIKVITHHFKEILRAFKIIIEVCGSKEDMKQYLDCLMKSVLYIVSSLIEDSNKESIEAVTSYLHLLNDVIESKSYPSLLCLKCVESLSKLHRKILISHCFNCGSLKSQDILCTTLLKMLFNPHLFPSEAPKRFFGTFNRLINSGINESFDTLLVTQKFMNIVRSSIVSTSCEIDVIIEVWSGIANPLLEMIEKTQEVNQGDKLEHDFSCMYDVLIFPFEFIFPVFLQQFRTRPAFKLWTNLYKTFIRCASLVVTSSTNEACEIFCSKLKSCLKEDYLKTPHFFEAVNLNLQVIMECIDFSSGTSLAGSGAADVALMTKRKKPLGNLTSFVELLTIILKSYNMHFIESEDETESSGVPTVQRKFHIVKNGAPLDLLKMYFGNIKTGSIIATSLEQLSDPLAKLYLKSSQKKNLMNHIDNKLENLWNVITSSIERYYLGPYDTDFLAVLNPILEATFSHPKRNFKEKSRKFWCATFGLNMTSLKVPESLKHILKKMKLLPDEVNPAEFSISPLQNSVSEDTTDINPLISIKTSDLKSTPIKTISHVNGVISKPTVKEIKPPSKVPIDELPSEEFVKIDSSVQNVSRRRSIRKRKSFVPSLYNDLSQDPGSTQDSQDTQSSISLEEPTFKKPPIELKEVKVMNSEEKSSAAPPEITKSVEECNKSEIIVLKDTQEKDINFALKNSLLNTCKSKSYSTKKVQIFEERNKTLKEQNNSENEVKPVDLPNKVKLIDSNYVKDPKDFILQEKSKQIISNLTEKISVFSKPGNEKRFNSRNNKQNKLSQSFSVPSDKSKEYFQKLNQTCIEITLSDSDEMIPSSQGTPDNDNNTKLKLDTYKVSEDQQKPVIIDLPNFDSVSPVKNDEFIDNNKEILTSTPAKKSILLDIQNNVLKKNNINRPNLVTEKESLLKNSHIDENKNTNINTEHKIMLVDENNEKNNIDSNEVKNIDFLLDAVEDLINNKPVIDNIKCDNTNISNTSSNDNKVMCTPESEKAPTEHLALEIEKTGKKSEVNISKRCLRKSMADSPQKEAYSLKLRNKTSNVTKPLSKPKQRKSMLKLGDCNKKVKQIKNKVSTLDEHLHNKSKDVDHTKNKIENKSQDLKNELHPVDKVLKTIPEVNVSIQQAHECIKLNEPPKSLLVNDIEMQDNAESCEIFKTDSENSQNSCKILQNNVNDCKDTLYFISSTDVIAPNDCELINNDISLADTNDEIDQKCLPDNELRSTHDDALNILSKPVDKIYDKCITIIPSSLENTTNDNPSTIISKKETEVNNSESSSSSEIKALCFEKQNININNTNETKSTMCIHFEDSEDDSNQQIHVIVDSIIKACGNAEDHKNNQFTSQESSPDEIASPSHLKETPNLSLGSNISENQQSESNKCEPISVKEIETPSQNKSQSYSDSIEAFNAHSCEVISSNEILQSQLSLDISNKTNNDNLEVLQNDIVESVSLELKISDEQIYNSENETDMKKLLENEDYQQVSQDKSIQINNSENETEMKKIIEKNEDYQQVSQDKSIHINNSENETEMKKIIENEDYQQLSQDKSIIEASLIQSNNSDLSNSNIKMHIEYENEEKTHSTFSTETKVLEDIESEVKCLIDDLLLITDKQEKGKFSVKQEISYNDISVQIPCTLKVGDSPTKALHEKPEIIVSICTDNVANKENKLGTNNLFLKGSKKRKIKPPIRSPINFRKKSKIDNSKKPLIKLNKHITITPITTKTQNLELVVSSSKLKTEAKECINSSTTHSLSPLVESILVDEASESDEPIHFQPCSSNTVNQFSKSHKIELSTDELTDLNTRLNASIAPQTRRSKLIASTQKTSVDNEKDTQLDIVIVSSQDSTTNNLSSILKKRKSSEDCPPPKQRKVTFASPLIQELVIESYSETKGLKTLTMSSIQNISKKRKKVLQEKNKSSKINSVQPSLTNASEDVPSSSEYQDSDVLDFCELPVSPALINCQDNISHILKDLTSPSWVRGLESLLISKNIKTIGDVCKLNIHQLKALPFKSPKVLTLHKALTTYLNHTQQCALEKFKTIDDGSFSMDTSGTSTSSNDISTNTEGQSNESDDSKLLVATVNDILDNDRLKDLPMNLLGELVKACGNVISKKYEQSCIVG